MDSEAIPSTTTTTERASTQTPLRMHTVVVFGDSLSDIGKKWTTSSGRMARAANEMYVSPTGRFSDCRNWTDFMFEAATHTTMIVDHASDTIALSARHTSLSRLGIMLHHSHQTFLYANYAEGGACGDKPASLAAVLGTFKDQVDAFEKDCKASGLALGNTLFIIWFGANDLYTANRKAEQMTQVAEQIASTQRARLKLIVSDQNQRTMRRMAKNRVCKFIFVDLCRPLTAVRYTKSLRDAESNVRKLVGAQYVAAARPRWGGIPQGGLFQASHTLQQATTAGYKTGKNWGRATEAELLHRQIELIKNLEQGVRQFNAKLKELAKQNGDQVAEIGNLVSEDTIRQLVQGNYRLQAGAMRAAVKTHIPSMSYSQSVPVQFTTTIDEVHPTDQMYRLIWLQIYEQIKRSGCTFGKLSPVLSDTPLAAISSRPPSAQTIQDYDAVMNELLATHPRTPPTRPD